MRRTMVVGGGIAAFTILAGIIGILDSEPTSISAPAPAIDNAPAGPGAGLLHGRVTTEDGNVYQGRLRFGGDEEALWGNYFNGYRAENPWAAYLTRALPPGERLSWTVFGIEIAIARRADLGRPFMARFGDIARIEARGRDLRVTLRSGTVVHLDRYAADDYADGVRVWDGSRGRVDLGERSIRSIEFLPAAPSRPGPDPLHGTVRTPHGEFTGFIQWDRQASLGTDPLPGQGREGAVEVRFDAIRSIARRSGEGALVTMRDGSEVVLSATRPGGRGNRGMYVDDPRYGRVLISWDAFEQLDFDAGPVPPAYRDFRPGQPLAGTVVTRSGERLRGRLVYDLDESETTATLDAPWKGVDYTIPFALIATIEPRPEGAVDAMVTLRGGSRLQLESAGDLAASNAGLLVFPAGRDAPEHVPWHEVERVELDPAPAAAAIRSPRRP